MAHDLTGVTATILPGVPVEIGAADAGRRDPDKDVLPGQSWILPLLDFKSPRSGHY